MVNLPAAVEMLPTYLYTVPYICVIVEMRKWVGRDWRVSSMLFELIYLMICSFSDPGGKMFDTSIERQTLSNHSTMIFEDYVSIESLL